MFVKILNYTFHYSFSGNKAQPVMLLLHGFMGNCQDFQEVVSVLAERFFCLAVDLPGHGKTEVIGPEECYNIANTAQALIQLLDRLAIEKCYLLGYSMGGRLALYLTLHFPSRFQKVILESASPGLKMQEARLQRLKTDLLLAQKLETGDFKEFLLNWYNQPLFQSLKTQPKFDELIERRLQNRPVELAKSLRNLGTGNQPSLWESLANNHIPILLLVGAYDRKFIAINQEMIALSQKIQLNIISNSGHNVHWENPKDYLNAMIDFCG